MLGDAIASKNVSTYEQFVLVCYKIGFEDIIVLFLASESKHYVLDFVRDVLQLVYFQEGFVLKFVDLEIKTEKELNFPSKEIHKNI